MKTYTLFLNSSSDFTINDQNGRTVSLARARKLWEAGQVNGSNQAFSRLANQFDFNLRKIKAFYMDGGRLDDIAARTRKRLADAKYPSGGSK